MSREREICSFIVWARNGFLWLLQPKSKLPLLQKGVCLMSGRISKPLRAP